MSEIYIMALRVGPKNLKCNVSNHEIAHMFISFFVAICSKFAFLYIFAGEISAERTEKESIPAKLMTVGYMQVYYMIINYQFVFTIKF